MTASAVTLAVAALAVAGAHVLGLIPSSPPEGGPLADTPAFGYAIIADVGESRTDALTVLWLPAGAGDSAEILEVDQVFSDAGLVSAGEWTAGEDRSREAAVVEQFYTAAPPADTRLGRIRGAVGTRIESRERNEYGTQLLLGVTVVEEGHHLRDGLWITYRHLDVTYRDFVPAKLTICTPAALAPDGTCHFLGADG